MIFDALKTNFSLGLYTVFALTHSLNLHIIMASNKAFLLPYHDLTDEKEKINKFSILCLLNIT